MSRTAGRRPKKGLDWFKKDVSYYEDFKVMDLINEYGPLGSTIFDCILCMIYREGYYLEVPRSREVDRQQMGQKTPGDASHPVLCGYRLIR